MRQSGLRMLLAAILLGLCWAAPSNALPLAWFGVEDFDTRSIPAFASERLETTDATAATEDATRAAQPPDLSQPDDALASAVSPVPPTILARRLPCRASAPGFWPVASSYHARAPPALT